MDNNMLLVIQYKSPCFVMKHTGQNNCSKFHIKYYLSRFYD